jgi:phospholipid/cholesterol/gamma-HCH transport system ATP-binding protein
MIELRNVDFSYGERPILRDVSFKIDERESVVIMGPSGSGKSTILRLILGLETPQRGEVLVDGELMSHIPEKQKRELRKRIGMVFQDGALFDSLTVGENVGYYLLEHTNLDWEEISDRVTKMLGWVGLIPEQVIDKLPEQLSGGMQRRVAIARALLSTDPSVMLYDEPTTGLDPQATETVLQLMNKLTQEKQISTIAVTHQIADAMTLTKRFLVIHGGEVAFDGSTDQLRDCPDPRVCEFLEPFKESMNLVVSKQFLISK